MGNDDSSPTQSAQSAWRPLFEPVSEQHERQDEWSHPLGFVIGGMATRAIPAERDAALADEYFTAANVLLDAILDQRVADYQVTNSALFLFSHCIEMWLKAGLPLEVRNENIHHLGKLAKQYENHQKLSGRAVPPWVIARCEELAAAGRHSQAFRYGEYGDYGRENEFLDERHVDLYHLRSVMTKLKAVLALPRASQGSVTSSFQV
jgi:hypothetical protein